MSFNKDLDHDPSEKYNIADKHPEALAAIEKAVQLHLKTLVRGEDQLAARLPRQ